MRKSAPAMASSDALPSQLSSAAIPSVGNTTTSTDRISSKLRGTELSTSNVSAFATHENSSSGFAGLTTATEEESCWSKTARKNRDEGCKTWETPSILRRVQDFKTWITKSAATNPQTLANKMTKKQLVAKQRWLQGYVEAEDKFAYVNGLSKVSELDMELLDPMFAYSVGNMKGEAEKAGEFAGVQDEGQLDWSEWRENYDDENPFLNK